MVSITDPERPAVVTKNILRRPMKEKEVDATQVYSSASRLLPYSTRRPHCQSKSSSIALFLTMVPLAEMRVLGVTPDIMSGSHQQKHPRAGKIARCHFPGEKVQSKIAVFLIQRQR